VSRDDRAGPAAGSGRERIRHAAYELFSRLGIRCFGFAPLQLPPDLDFSGMFHGVDERVPVDALRFGVRVLDSFLDRC